MRARLAWIATAAAATGLGALLAGPVLDGGPTQAASAPAPSTDRALEPATTRAADARPTVIWIGGDVLLSGAMRRSARRDGDPAAGFAEMLAPTAVHWGADGPAAFVLVNLEMPVAARRRVSNDAFRHLKRDDSRVPAPLNAPPWLLDGLRRAGVDGVMLANNHALDQERQGLAETIDAARRAGLVVTGAGRAPHHGWPLVLGDGDSRTAVLAFFEKDFPEPELGRGEAGLSVLGPGSAERVRAAAHDHAAVVVVVHVVAELVDRVKRSWRPWAQELARAGADVIALHGTHVPGPVETLRVGGRDVVVAWGLGNLVSDMGMRARPGRDPSAPADKWSEPATREALLLRVEVSGGEVDARLLPTWMAHDRYLLHNHALQAEHPTFRLLPLAACGRPVDLPGRWPDDPHAEMLEWVAERRDHLIDTAGLDPASCRDGEVMLLRPPPFNGTL